MPRDPVLAYVWFDRAAAALQVDAVRHRTDVARGLTADRLKEAQAQSLALEAGETYAKRAKGNGR